MTIRERIKDLWYLWIYMGIQLIYFITDHSSASARKLKKPKFHHKQIVFFRERNSVLSYENTKINGIMYCKGFIEIYGSFYSEVDQENHYIVSRIKESREGILVKEPDLISIEEFYNHYCSVDLTELRNM